MYFTQKTLLEYFLSIYVIKVLSLHDGSSFWENERYKTGNPNHPCVWLDIPAKCPAGFHPGKK